MAHWPNRQREAAARIFALALPPVRHVPKCTTQEPDGVPPPNATGAPLAKSKSDNACFANNCIQRGKRRRRKKKSGSNKCDVVAQVQFRHAQAKVAHAPPLFVGNGVHDFCIKATAPKYPEVRKEVTFTKQIFVESYCAEPVFTYQDDYADYLNANEVCQSVSD